MKAKIKSIRWALGLLLSIFGPAIHGEERWILPDSFSIATYNGVPQIQLTRNEAGYVAKINFKAAYDRVARYVLDAEPDALISELAITPTSIKTLLTAESSLFLKAYSMTPSTGGAQLRLEFTSSMDEAAVLRLLRVLNIFGFADAYVTCPTGSAVALCGAKIVGMPLYNQYRETPNHVADDAARRLFLINNRKYELLLSDPIRFKTFADLERYIAGLISSGCQTVIGADFTFCNVIRPYQGFADAVRALSRAAFGDKAGDELGAYILSPEQITGHQGRIVRLEMRDLSFAWPGTSWGQMLPADYPNFWTMDFADEATPDQDMTFGENFFLSKFSSGFYFTDQAGRYGFGTGGFTGWSSMITGEAFRISGTSRGELLGGHVSVRFELRDEKNSTKPYLEIASRAPGENAWTSARIVRQPEGTTNKTLDSEAIFDIQGLFVPEGWELMMRLVIPPEIAWDSRGQSFTLYQAELSGARCPLAIFQKFPRHCK